MPFRRVLLKLSGEALMGEKGYGIDPAVIDRIAAEIAAVVAGGTQMAVVVGGGNIFRGLKGAAAGMERATADYMGMLATVMNAIALQDALERQDGPVSGANSHHHAGAGGALHPPPCHATPGEGACGDLRRRLRESVFHHGHHGSAAGCGDWCGRGVQGHKGGWRLRQGPGLPQGCCALRNTQLSAAAARENLR